MNCDNVSVDSDELEEEYTESDDYDSTDEEE